MGLRKNRMRRIKSIKIQNESIEDQIKANRHNPCLEVAVPTPKGTNILKISAGTRDEITVFQFGKYTLVVNINRPLNYVGMDIFDGEENIMEVFYDDQDVRETFGNKQLTPENVARALFFNAAETSPHLYDR